MDFGLWVNTDYEPRIVSSAMLSVAFSGYSHVASALKHSEKVRPFLAGEQYIAFGGGDVHGNFNPCCIASITEALIPAKKEGLLSDYDGIAYCLQEGVSDLVELFEDSFLMAKKQGFKVLVSCAPPFSFDDADLLLSRFFANENIDIFSPQINIVSTDPEDLYSVLDLVPDSVSCYATLVPMLTFSEFIPDAIKGKVYVALKHYFKSKNRIIEGVLFNS